MAWPAPEFVPSILAKWTDEDRDAFILKYDEVSRSLRDSLKSSGLWAEMTHEERALFEARLLDRTMQQVLNAAWSMEALACCLWALGILPEIPAYDSQASVLDQVPKGEASAAGELRPATEIERARRTAELWHWRSRTRQLLERGVPFHLLPDGRSGDDIVRFAAEQAAIDGYVPATCGADFPAFGKPYRELSPVEFSIITSIACERHKALNWLCGLAPNNQWDQTPTDT
jgi:hypothetical protein